MFVRWWDSVVSGAVNEVHKIEYFMDANTVIPMNIYCSQAVDNSLFNTASKHIIEI